MPTRGRLNQALDAINSLFDRALKRTSFNIHILCDHDDEKRSFDYLSNKFKRNQSVFVYKNFKKATMGELLKRLCRKALTFSEVIFPMPDDYLMETNAWDQIILEEFLAEKKHPIS